MCPLVWRTAAQRLVIVADALQVWDRRIVRYGEAEVAFAFAHRSCSSRTQHNWFDPARRGKLLCTTPLYAFLAASFGWPHHVFRLTLLIDRCPDAASRK